MTVHEPEDDGVSRAYESGAYALTGMRCAASADAVHLSLDARRGEYAGMPGTRGVIAQVYLPAAPSRVTLGGSSPLPSRDSRGALDSSPGWWHDGEHFLWLSFSQAGAPIDLAIHRTP